MASKPRVSTALVNGYLSAADAAALRVRVDNLADDVHGIRSEVRDLASALSLQLRGLEQKQDIAQKPNWQMWGVAITALIALGTLAYWPILRSVDKNEKDINNISLLMQEKVVSNQVLAERDRRVAVYSNDINTLLQRSYAQNAEISSLRADTRNMELRFDAISRRLAEFIRDSGKH